MTAPTLTVSIDAMGGDAGPSVVVAAVGRAIIRHPTVKFLLHGDEAELQPLVSKRAKFGEKVEIRHAPERVKMEDKPSQIVRRGRNTSMWRAIESVAKKEADVAISAGNTGALMAMSLLQLRTLESIDRPAIAALWPPMPLTAPPRTAPEPQSRIRSCAVCTPQRAAGVERSASSSANGHDSGPWKMLPPGMCRARSMSLVV